jgi:hypothetical protein
MAELSTTLAGCRITALASLTMMMMAVPAAKADWAYTKWGMSPEQIAKASNAGVHIVPEAQRKTVEEANLRTGAEGIYKDGDVDVNVAFAFDAKNGGLECVFYTVLDSAKNSALRDLMTKRYGEPNGHSDIPAIGMIAMNWQKPTDEIDLQCVKDNPAGVSHCKLSKA